MNFIACKDKVNQAKKQIYLQLSVIYPHQNIQKPAL
jgi:hypothetical protein